MIQIPPDRLSPDVLDALVEEFISREGTDYGDREINLSAKVEQVKKQIHSGKVVITFDPETESCNLLTQHDVRLSESF